ncbi:MAG TPA: intradiol ring-cleavage dioxygenase [Pirellulales bacterium]
MKPLYLSTSRRQFIGGVAAGMAIFTTRGLFAEALSVTPRLTEGPFYPDKLPLDTDNDLIIVNDSATPALGDITHLTGRILTAAGTPVRDAFVEIWQVDANGVYLNTHDQGHDHRDKNFQGYGRFLTGSDGGYYFRTIKPIHYTGRTAHIHFGISQNGRRIYTTQLFIKGNSENDRDGVFNGIRDQKAKDSVLVDFQPIADSKIGELAANFDIVMGLTPQDPPKDDDGKIKGGIGKSEGDGPGGPGGFRGGPPGGRGGRGRFGGPPPGDFDGPPPDGPPPR